MSDELIRAILFGCAIAATIGIGLIATELQKIRKLLERDRR